MKRIAPLVLVALLAACSTSASSPDLLVSIYSGSEAKAAFLPQLDSTSTIVWLTPEAAGRTADGQVVSGFRFSSRRVSEGVRVRVYALTSRSFTQREKALDAVRLADYTVGSGSEVQIEAMSALGVPPMSLRAEPYGARST